MKCFELHHDNYHAVGAESLADVRILCGACHGITHDRPVYEATA